ncbi:hypothetical protein DUNSADRAFT_5226, partial [Dunaliella salina]
MGHLASNQTSQVFDCFSHSALRLAAHNAGLLGTTPGSKDGPSDFHQTSQASYHVPNTVPRLIWPCNAHHRPAGSHAGPNRRTSQADSTDGSMDDLASAAMLSSREGASAWRIAYVGASTQARVNGLLPATHYWCRATGLNRTGPGACSQAEAFTSALLPPGPPQ